MKNLRFSTTITAIPGFLSFLAVALLFLALNDIAAQKAYLTPEWYIEGICMIILGGFIVSTLITVVYLLSSKILETK